MTKTEYGLNLLVNFFLSINRGKQGKERFLHKLREGTGCLVGVTDEKNIKTIKANKAFQRGEGFN